MRRVRIVESGTDVKRDCAFMTQVALPYTQKLRLRPRRVTRQAAEEACRVVWRHFDSTEIQPLRTDYPIRGAQEDEASSIAVNAPTITELLSAPVLAEAVPLGAVIELTSLTIAADGPLRTVRIAITPYCVDIDITGTDPDWVQARGREFRAIFTPRRRMGAPGTTFQRRDFVIFGLGIDTLGIAVLVAMASQDALASPAVRLAAVITVALVPAICWMTARRILRRCRVRIALVEPTGWWQSMDTMTRLTLGMFLAALLTIVLSVAQNGITGGDHAGSPHSRIAMQEDGIQ
ncbi:hypothetical protein [Streptomyces chartreusis]|uniref:hypothetical protein n=1 Tax=Streptomyces chartreusis TaxID=1969 RepID=UPI003648849E